MIKEGSVEWGQLLRMLKKHGWQDTLRGVRAALRHDAKRVRKREEFKSVMMEAASDVVDYVAELKGYPALRGGQRG